MKDYISIGRAARIAGVHEDTLRNWEDEGIIKPIRTLGGHRRYKESDIREIAKIMPAGSNELLDAINKLTKLLQEWITHQQHQS